jgi:hypothetical protein
VKGVTRDHVIDALYVHGPCSAATVAAVIALRLERTKPEEADAVSNEVGAQLAALGAMVSSRRVALRGTDIEPVTLVYLRGGGVG